MRPIGEANRIDERVEQMEKELYQIELTIWVLAPQVLAAGLPRWQ